MPSLPLTPEQKADKKLRDNLKIIHNRVLGAWSFHQLVSWEDLNKFFPCERKGKIEYKDLKDFLQSQVTELEKHIKESHEHPISSNISSSIRESDKTLDKTEPETLNKDYGLHKSPNEKAFLFWFQKKTVKELWDGITIHKKRGQLLLAATGTGKTYMIGGLNRRLEDINFHKGKTWSHIPYLYVTRATVVQQTERVFKNFFSLGVEQMEIINIEQLRSRAGQLWVKEEVKIENGEEKSFWTWKKNINPCVVWWDECQALKNESSTQHQIASAYSNLASKDTYQIFISATPFTRVIEAKCFAVSTRRPLDHLGFPRGSILTNETWPAYAAAIAAPSKPDEYNEAAVDRLMNDLDDYVVRVKGVRPQFDALNGTQIIDFASPEEKAYYDNAWERYLKEKAKLEAQQLAGDGGNIGMMILVQFLKFRMAAEYCRRKHLAKAMYESVQAGKAAVCALNFKNTIIAIVQTLVNDYKVPRDQISLVWGDGQTQLTKKQKVKQKIKSKSAAFEAMGMSTSEMLEELDLDVVEDRELMDLDPALRLGMQSTDERQREIDKFQRGESLYCLYTFKAGGIGLSLHHSDELTKQKVKKKESGYAYEEDIPNIPVRPRENYVAPTYSAIELVQGLGRCPRLTSLSSTTQTLIFYRGTIEEDVAEIVKKKLRCLSRVVRNRESWEDIIIDHHKHSAHLQEHLNAVPEETNGDNLLLGEGDSEE